MERRLRYGVGEGDAPEIGDQIITELAAAYHITTRVLDDGAIAFDNDAFVDLLRSKGYRITRTDESVTFTIVNG